jgi:hypothetical protein
VECLRDAAREKQGSDRDPAQQQRCIIQDIHQPVCPLFERLSKSGAGLRCLINHLPY